MESEIKKQMKTYQKSFRYYSKLSLVILVAKCILGSSGLSAFACTYLSILSLGAPILDLITRHLSIEEKKTEYYSAFRFYEDCLNKYKCHILTELNYYEQETYFLKTMHYLPRKKYIVVV